MSELICQTCNAYIGTHSALFKTYWGLCSDCAYKAIKTFTKNSLVVTKNGERIVIVRPSNDIKEPETYEYLD